MSTPDENSATDAPPRDKRTPENRERWEAAKASAIGIQFVISILVGAGLGYWLDSRFDTFPLLTAIGFAIGLTAAFRELYLLARSASESD